MPVMHVSWFDMVRALAGRRASASSWEKREVALGLFGKLGVGLGAGYHRSYDRFLSSTNVQDACSLDCIHMKFCIQYILYTIYDMDDLEKVVTGGLLLIEKSTQQSAFYYLLLVGRPVRF